MGLFTLSVYSTDVEWYVFMASMNDAERVDSAY